MAVTMKDVAKMAGVSLSTVSLVLNKNAGVGDSTRKRVLKIIEDTGYKPNVFARGLVNARNYTIVVLLPELSNIFGDIYFGKGVSGIYDTANKRGYKIILEQASYEFAASKKYLTVFKEHSAEGMLYIGSTIRDTYFIDFVGSEYPFIFVNSHLKNMDLSYVIADNYGVGREVVNYFHELGHTKIGFMYGSMDVPGTIDQYEGFKTTLNDNGIKINHNFVINGEFTQAGGYKAALDLINNNNGEIPSAIFCGNDLMALGAMKAFNDSGIKVPDKIAVIGCDDIEFASYSEPKLTTFKQDIYSIASTACDRLIDMIENKKVETVKEKVEMEMIIRDSCGGKKALKSKTEKSIL